MWKNDSPYFIHKEKDEGCRNMPKYGKKDALKGDFAKIFTKMWRDKGYPREVEK